jgi:tetratricopeptide (TPR) repeat protein
MHWNWPYVRGLIGLIFLGLVVLALVFQTIRKSEDPALTLFKWILTAGTLFVLFGYVAGIVGKGGYGGAFTGIPLTAACGLVLAFTWRKNIAMLVASPIASLYDGGNDPPDPVPLYSIARAKQKKGLFLEAINDVREQLKRFPNDVEGNLLLAEIQAEDLKDMAAAELTIHRFCNQEGHAPKNIAYAFYALADWFLEVELNPDGARKALEQVIERFPGSELASGAAHRIAHLATSESLLSARDGRTYQVPEGIHNLGLVNAREVPEQVEVDPETQAREYVLRLTEHPLDTEAREKLAMLYARSFDRLDLAQGELEQLISDPTQPPKLCVRWLNLLADLQMRHGASYETIRATLERIIEKAPAGAAAELARNRIELIRLEQRAMKKGQVVKLGSYEQNIGLKRGSPGAKHGG